MAVYLDNGAFFGQSFNHSPAVVTQPYAVPVAVPQPVTVPVPFPVTVTQPVPVPVTVPSPVTERQVTVILPQQRPPQYLPTVQYQPQYGGLPMSYQPTNMTNAQMVAQASDPHFSGVVPGQYFTNQIAVTTGGRMGTAFSHNAFGSQTLAHSQAAARALDAADGVIDGQHFGSRIGVARNPSFTGGNMTFASSQAAARALDAADGVIDGQHFGSRVAVNRNPSLTGGNVAFANSQAAARALDAADGVIDGRHFGSQVAVRR